MRLIKAIVYYQHDVSEVARLSAAIIPLADHIRAVSSNLERARMRDILGFGTFRYRDAQAMRSMLLRAAKHARANLGDYFPMMQADIIGAAENLEEAVKNYWQNFRALEREIMPVP